MVSKASRLRRVRGSFAVAFCLVSAPALGDVTKEQCLEANGKAQELRRELRLSAARAELHICADPECPAIVRDDCAKRLDEIEKAQPSIVFEVKDANGADVINVRVSVDGKPLADHLDGSALKVDPGPYEFTFEVAGQPPVVEKLLVREGEGGRHVSVVVTGAASSAAPAPLLASQPAPSPSPPATSAGGLGTLKLVGLVVGGAGVASLAVGSIFGAMGSSAWSSAKTACGGNTSACTNVASGLSHRSTAEGDATASTVAFIAGGVLLATGVVLFLTGGHEKDAGSALVVGPSVGPQQGGVILRGTLW
jgi:hypothetical protein